MVIHMRPFYTHLVGPRPIEPQVRVHVVIKHIVVVVRFACPPNEAAPQDFLVILDELYGRHLLTGPT